MSSTVNTSHFPATTAMHYAPHAQTVKALPMTRFFSTSQSPPRKTPLLRKHAKRSITFLSAARKTSMATQTDEEGVIKMLLISPVYPHPSSPPSPTARIAHLIANIHKACLDGFFNEWIGNTTHNCHFHVRLSSNRSVFPQQPNDLPGSVFSLYTKMAHTRVLRSSTKNTLRLHQHPSDFWKKPFRFTQH